MKPKTQGLSKSEDVGSRPPAPAGYAALAAEAYAYGVKVARKSKGGNGSFDLTWEQLTIHQRRGFTACFKWMWLKRHNGKKLNDSRDKI